MTASVQRLRQANLVAGNATDVGQRLLFSAKLGVQAGGHSGSDNTAHSSNDLQQAHALAATIGQSTLAPAKISSSLSQAIAAAMESSIEPAALLVETANIVNRSSAVPVVAQAFRQVTMCSAISDLLDEADPRVAVSPLAEN